MAGACAPFGGREPAPLPARVPVEVVNHNPHAASIYRMADGTRTLIGTVESGARSVFEVPFPPSRQLSIEVRLDPVGSYRSWAVFASPGQVIRVEIPADLHQVHGLAD
jgi:hypothetical protein